MPDLSAGRHGEAQASAAQATEALQSSRSVSPPVADYSGDFASFSDVFSACLAENPNSHVVRGGFASGPGKGELASASRRRNLVEDAEAAARRVRATMAHFLSLQQPQAPQQGHPGHPATLLERAGITTAAGAAAQTADGGDDAEVVGDEESDAAASGALAYSEHGAGSFRVPFRGSKMALLTRHATRLGEQERARRAALDMPEPPLRVFRVLPAGRAEVYHLVRLALEQASGGGWVEAPAAAGDSPCWHLYWSWGKPQVVRANLLSVQRFNHFRHARELTRKDLLKKNLSRYQCLGGRMARAFAVLPPTFVLPKEYLAFAEAFGRAAFRGEGSAGNYGLVGGGTGMGAAGSAATLAARAAMALSAGKLSARERGAPAKPEDNVWILKPVGLSRGRGISLVREITDVTYGTPCVLQRYVGNPMLLDGYKFDLRVYVLVTSFSPLEAFVYERGFARVSSVPYSREVASTYDKSMHLTNSSLQKHNRDKGAAVAEAVRAGEGGGTKVSLQWVWRRLAAGGADPVKCWRRVKDVVVKSLVCVDDVIPHQPNCFELYGYDVLLDDAQKAHLIEVNSSPSLGVDSDLDTAVKLSLVRDIARVVDPLPFDHAALLSVLDRRLQATALARTRPRHHSMGLGVAAPSGSVQRGAEREALDRHLSEAFRGKCPRPYGVPPPEPGHFTMLCPGSDAYKKVLRLKLAHLAGAGRRAAATAETAARAAAASATRSRPPVPRPVPAPEVSTTVRVGGLPPGPATALRRR